MRPPCNCGTSWPSTGRRFSHFSNDGFSRQAPGLESKLDTINSKLSVVEEGAEKASNLVAITDDLDRQIARLSTQGQFIERIEGRLNDLNVLSGEVDRKVREQLVRRTEIDALKSQCDGLGIQVTDTQQKLDVVSTLQNKLLPLTAQLSMLKGQIEKARARFQEA